MTRTVTVGKQQKCREGMFYRSGPTWRTFSEDVRLLKPDGSPLAVLKRNAIPKGVLAAGRELGMYITPSDTRPKASGLDREQIIAGKRFNRGKAAPTTMVGYAGPSSFHPCRLTRLYRLHVEHFDSVTLKLVAAVNAAFRRICPKEYRAQQEFVRKCNPNMVLGGTVFTTLTVNRDWRTAAHYDSGDFHSGLGNLCVFDAGEYAGGELLLPEYKVALALKEGDILFMDVHELHCNNPIRGKGRMSLVCYAIESIKDKCGGLSRKQLLDYGKHALVPSGKCALTHSRSSAPSSRPR